MKSLPILLCLLALAACSGKPPEPKAKAADVATPFDALKADEQRAKDVQKVINKQTEEQRKQIEAQQQ
jgi:ABC-type glycerol-3-phosphate transport system substrate-binding protein